MSKFRVSRKEKKRIKKSGILLYPPDNKGNSLMADPLYKQEDLLAFRNGELESIWTRSRTYDLFDILNREIDTPFSDDQLRESVNYIFGEQYRESSFNSLKRAFNSTNKNKYYIQYVNAYLETIREGGEDLSITCCLIVDRIDNKY